MIKIKNRYTDKIIYENKKLQNLSGANLPEADLSRASLSRASLSGASLYGADLSRANLSGANLSGANLYGANLSGANLSGANLYGASLSGANLYGASLSGAKLDKYYQTSLNILKTQKHPITAYKYLKSDMTSPYQHYPYYIGKKYQSLQANSDESVLCGAGINIATLQWCLQQTKYNLKDFMYVEVEVRPQDLIIPFNSNGKFRIKSGGWVEFKKILTEQEIKTIIGDTDDDQNT